MSVLIFLIVSYILLSISLYMIFPKADVPAIDGLIPGKNFVQWAKIIGRSAYWPLWLLFPIVNIFIFCGMAVDLVRSFRKYKFIHTAAAVIYAPAAIAWVARDEKSEYDGPNYIKEKEYNDQLREAHKARDKAKVERLHRRNPYKKSALREWVESIVFAVFAAAFIRLFLIEAFVIPTPSMEGSLMVGDFLFVSKASYGIRTPMTVAMIPLLHNRVPVVGGESYLKKPSLKYNRLPPLENIERNKPIVFNWPVGDSVYITSKRSYTLGQARRNKEFLAYDRELAQKVRKNDFVVRPIDKKDHYIKRCIAMPGDSLQIIDRQVYVNGEKQKNPDEMQFLYRVTLPVSYNPKKLKEWGIGDTDTDIIGSASGPQGYFLNNKQAEQLKSLGNGVKVEVFKNNPEPKKLFPHDPKNFKNWSVDNFGPIWIPKAGETIEINQSNIAMYERVISVYESNELEIGKDGIRINGEIADSYTFKQDYYWAMGDNRHNSEDSRMWGYVPHDHIVGKPLFIWFSTKNARISDGIRFNRIFKSANVD
ncbi:MAG: signal peptidase I [Saprospiraceae bacterium]|nr:signal peptidase I [Saprospiraceae bacterium]